MEEINQLRKTIEELERKISDLEKQLQAFKPVNKTLYEKG